jgi:hypothetical protein
LLTRDSWIVRTPTPDNSAIEAEHMRVECSASAPGADSPAINCGESARSVTAASRSCFRILGLLFLNGGLSAVHFSAAYNISFSRCFSSSLAAGQFGPRPRTVRDFPVKCCMCVVSLVPSWGVCSFAFRSSCCTFWSSPKVPSHRLACVISVLACVYF